MKIMVVDNDKSMCELIESSLSKSGYNISSFTSPEQAFKELLSSDFDTVLTDMKMNELDGLQFCERIITNLPDIPVIIMTAFGSMETAISAIRAGAYDFIAKPFDMDILTLIIDRALKHRKLNKEIQRLSSSANTESRFQKIIGKSKVMLNLYDLISRAADSEASVLITGESGTGKELVATALHNKSKRNSGPFIPINCSAIPDTLLESELFGHKRGAFTDAVQDKNGLFIQADNGTLFLDEIGEIPLNLQAKLLRAIEEQTVWPLGSEKEIKFNVRILSASNKNIETMVKEGIFREDLYYRLNVININVPPLRSRGNDIILLSDYYLKHFSDLNKKQITSISRPAMKKLLYYNWPGNVRELRNVIERAVALTNHSQIIVEDLPDNFKDYINSDVLIVQNDLGNLVSMEELEKRYIMHILNKTNNNKSLAARILGFDRKTLYNKLSQFEIQQ